MSAEGNLPAARAGRRGGVRSRRSIGAVVVVAAAAFAGRLAAWGPADRRLAGPVAARNGVAYVSMARCATGRCQSLWIGPTAQQRAGGVETLAGDTEQATRSPGRQTAVASPSCQRLPAAHLRRAHGTRISAPSACSSSPTAIPPAASGRGITFSQRRRRDLRQLPARSLGLQARPAGAEIAGRGRREAGRGGGGFGARTRGGRGAGGGGSGRRRRAGQGGVSSPRGRASRPAGRACSVSWTIRSALKCSRTRALPAPRPSPRGGVVLEQRDDRGGHRLMVARRRRAARSGHRDDFRHAAGAWSRRSACRRPSRRAATCPAPR